MFLFRSMDGKRRSGKPRQRYVRATQWRRRRFFALLEETGQVRLAAELSGLGLGCIYRLRRLEAGFGERMIAARVAAGGRLDRRTPAEGPGGEAGDGLVVRRGPGGRLRAVAPHRGWWGERDDAVFLGALREPGASPRPAASPGSAPAPPITAATGCPASPLRGMRRSPNRRRGSRRGCSPKR